MERRFYGTLRRERVFMLLRAIEEVEQAGAVKSEAFTVDWAKLQIEHIMPQSWRQFWDLPDNVSAESRDGAVANIGNLTLVGEKLNPSLSNAPWLPTEKSKLHKRSELQKHSKLECNRPLVEETAWDEVRIKARAERLLGIARQIWPSAHSLSAQSAGQ